MLAKPTPEWGPALNINKSPELKEVRIPLNATPTPSTPMVEFSPEQKKLLGPSPLAANGPTQELQIPKLSTHHNEDSLPRFNSV